METKKDMKVLLEKLKKDGTKDVVGVDLGDLASLKALVVDAEDGMLLALAESLDNAHTSIHDAMDVIMKEGAKRTARKMLSEIKKDPERAAKVIGELTELLASMDPKGVTEDDLAGMEVKGHA